MHVCIHSGCYHEDSHRYRRSCCTHIDVCGEVINAADSAPVSQLTKTVSLLSLGPYCKASLHPAPTPWYKPDNNNPQASSNHLLGALGAFSPGGAQRRSLGLKLHANPGLQRAVNFSVTALFGSLKTSARRIPYGLLYGRALCPPVYFPFFGLHT